MKKSTRNALIVLAVVGLTLIILSPTYLLLQTIVPPGWEIYDQICGVEHKDKLYTRSRDFTTPRECKGVYWKVDLDEPYYHVPTLQIVIGDLQHVDFSGKPRDADRPADTIFIERGNHSFYLDLHIYLFTVTIRTIADKELIGTHRWAHETSWSHEEWDPLTGDRGHNEKIGERFTGGVYEKFVISPWRGFTYRDPPESGDPDNPYVLDNCWAGVMNAYVHNIEMGQVENQWGEMPDPDADYWIKAPIPEGNQVPMFKDDGTFGNPAPTITWGTSVTPDTRIESTVVLYTPTEMLAGCKYKLNIASRVIDIYPCDVYIMYTLRVDVLTTHGFVLQSAIKPPEPVPPSDFFSWAESFWEALLGGLNPFKVFGPFAPLVAWLTLFGLIGIAVLILLAIFAPGVLMALGMGTKKVKEAFSKKKKGKG